MMSIAKDNLRKTELDSFLNLTRQHCRGKSSTLWAATPALIVFTKLEFKLCRKIWGFFRIGSLIRTGNALWHITSS
jgi:hypothetical protein